VNIFSTRSGWKLPLPVSPQTIAILTMAVAPIGLSSCTQAPSAPPTVASPVTTDLKVVTSTLPVTDFTKAVVGDRAEVVYLLPPNVGPHDYQSKPEDVRTLAEADVLVKNGLGLDEYLDPLIENANNTALKIIDTSEGVQTIAHEEEAGHDHGHEHGHEHEEAGAEAADAEAADGHKHEGEFNPHIWLDPKRAIEQVENIRDGLVAADPAGEKVYVANAAAYIEKLNALDQEIAAALKPFAGKEFVTYHDFAPYFAQRYALKTEFLVGVPEEDPSPADVQRVVNSAQASDLKTLLTEPQASGNPFEALAKDLQVQVSAFDPMETGSPQSLESGYYLKVMRQNLKNLQTAFGAKP
jgi:zinc transport system substrate-binding protein